jgi:aryl-phospho-beta-D-glucosidase BglC (GH1 family)
MWKYIAKEFRDAENVIGYEILNEPFGGNVYANGLGAF